MTRSELHLPKMHDTQRDKDGLVRDSFTIYRHLFGNRDPHLFNPQNLPLIATDTFWLYIDRWYNALQAGKQSLFMRFHYAPDIATTLMMVPAAKLHYGALRVQYPVAILNPDETLGGVCMSPANESYQRLLQEGMDPTQITNEYPITEHPFMYYQGVMQNGAPSGIIWHRPGSNPGLIRTDQHEETLYSIS